VRSLILGRLSLSVTPLTYAALRGLAVQTAERIEVLFGVETRPNERTWYYMGVPISPRIATLLWPQRQELQRADLHALSSALLLNF